MKWLTNPLPWKPFDLNHLTIGLLIHMSPIFGKLDKYIQTRQINMHPAILSTILYRYGEEVVWFCQHKLGQDLSVWRQNCPYSPPWMTLVPKCPAQCNSFVLSRSQRWPLFWSLITPRHPKPRWLLMTCHPQLKGSVLVLCPRHALTHVFMRDSWSHVARHVNWTSISLSVSKAFILWKDCWDVHFDH